MERSYLLWSLASALCLFGCSVFSDAEVSSQPPDPQSTAGTGGAAGGLAKVEDRALVRLARQVRPGAEGTGGATRGRGGSRGTAARPLELRVQAENSREGPPGEGEPRKEEPAGLAELEGPARFLVAQLPLRGDAPRRLWLRSVSARSIHTAARFVGIRSARRTSENSAAVRPAKVRPPAERHPPIASAPRLSRSPRTPRSPGPRPGWGSAGASVEVTWLQKYGIPIRSRRRRSWISR